LLLSQGAALSTTTSTGLLLSSLLFGVVAPLLAATTPFLFPLAMFAWLGFFERPSFSAAALVASACAAAALAMPPV
jgi:hypothetical protein